ncbi:PAC2 family protein, partial [Candidatus Hodarchaeum mangrovi]
PIEDFDDVFLVGEPQFYEENVEFVKHNFKKPHTGFISGLSGAIMNEALLTQIQGLTLLAAIKTPYPDPGGAAKLIEAVNKVKGLSIDTSKLISDAKQIQQSMLELAERNRQVSEQEIVGPRRGLYV